MNDSTLLNRWRLLLGTQSVLGKLEQEDDFDAQSYSDVLDYLFSSDEGSKTKKGGTGSSQFTIPEWVNHVDDLFPQTAKQQLESELIRRKGITALLKDPELLERIEPSLDLARTLLTFKNQLNDKTKKVAKKVIHDVVDELKQKIKLQVEPSLIGALKRDRHSSRKVIRNLDLKTTLRRNLQNWNADREQLIIDQSWYYASERNARPWHIVIGIDQSGSMADSVIFSAIMGSIFYELPSTNTSIFVFDTEVVDLTPHIQDPVDILFRVQLGGGTTIDKAASYAQELVRDAQRTIFILISDFYEGGNEQLLIERISDMQQAGVRQIGLAALSYDATPAYNQRTAKKLKKAGMNVLECTPEQLAECVIRIIN